MNEVTCVRGDSFVVSDPSGDVLRGGDHGVYLRDTRCLDVFEFVVDGAPPRPLSATTIGSSGALFHGFVPRPDAGPDPVLLVERRRSLTPGLCERIRLINHGRTDVDVELELRFGSDLAYIFDVRHQRTLPPIEPEAVPHGLAFERAGSVDRIVVEVDPPPDRRGDSTLVCRCRVPAGGTERLVVRVTATDVYGTVGPGAPAGAPAAASERATGRRTASSWSLRCADHRLQRLVERSLEDLQALRLTDPEAPEDEFCAAGSPWYLTLFGRDALWTGLMALPFDLELAHGTLRALGRRQGRRHDPGTEEAPGKILHEIRRGSLTHRGDLPPNYYGTIDATPLFVILAHEAWRFGLDDARTRALLPNVEAALTWMRDAVEANHDGFLAYRKLEARGLDNQGWKDSHDGVQFADGSLAQPPIALAEVQGYAHDAARRGAELLEHFQRPGVVEWQRWADELRARFRDAFWIDDTHGRYPAIALDGAGRRVDGPASNMGHLLATGLIDDAEVADVARQLLDPRLVSGWGLRTLSSSSAGFNPLSYHAGSVWPHDTAIAVWGLASRGRREAAVALLQGLVQVAPGFAYRMPELFGGFSRDAVPAPVPYPTACRPQAWAAAAALLLVRACLGLHADVPHGRVRLAPLWPPPFRTLEIDDLPIGDDRLHVKLDRDQGVEVRSQRGLLTVEVEYPTP